MDKSRIELRQGIVSYPHFVHLAGNEIVDSFFLKKKITISNCQLSQSAPCLLGRGVVCSHDIYAPRKVKKYLPALFALQVQRDCPLVPIHTREVAGYALRRPLFSLACCSPVSCLVLLNVTMQHGKKKKIKEVGPKITPLPGCSTFITSAP